MIKSAKIILLFLISSASVLATFISPEIGLIKVYFSLTNDQTGMVMTCYLAGYLIGQFTWAYISNLIGRARSISVGAFVAIIGSILLLYSYSYHNFNVFVISRSIIGFGLSAGLVCGFAIIKENLTMEYQKKYLALVAVFFTASIYTSISISGYIVQHASLYLIFWSVFCLCSGFFILSIFFKTTANKNDTNRKIVKNIKSKGYPQLLAYSFALSITTIIAYCYAFYAPLITSQLFSLSPKSYGNYSLINMASIFFGSFFFALLNKRHSETTICFIGLILIIISSLCFIQNYFDLKESVNAFFLYCSLLSFSSGMIYPASTYIALDFSGCKARASAIMNAIKLSLPIIAIYFSTKIFDNNLNGFCFTILSFSVIYFLLLYFVRARLTNQPIIT